MELIRVQQLKVCLDKNEGHTSKLILAVEKS